MPARTDTHALQQALAGALHAAPKAARAPGSVVVVGAAGALGHAVLEGAISLGGHAAVHVAVVNELAIALRGVHPVRLHVGREGDADFARAPRVAADVAVVVFDQPLSRRGREDAFYLPQPARLAQLAAWLRDCGVTSLVVVLPHAPGSLPEALKRGLANLDEHAVAALGWRHFVMVRPTRDAPRATTGHSLQRLGQWMLAQLNYMVPQRERPLRAVNIARFVTDLVRALPEAPAGTRVAAPELLFDHAQASDGAALVQAWLRGQAVAPTHVARERM